MIVIRVFFRGGGGEKKRIELESDLFVLVCVCKFIGLDLDASNPNSAGTNGVGVSVVGISYTGQAPSVLRSLGSELGWSLLSKVVWDGVNIICCYVSAPETRLFFLLSRFDGLAKVYFLLFVIQPPLPHIRQQFPETGFSFSLHFDTCASCPTGSHETENDFTYQQDRISASTRGETCAAGRGS